MYGESVGFSHQKDYISIAHGDGGEEEVDRPLLDENDPQRDRG